MARYLKILIFDENGKAWSLPSPHLAAELGCSLNAPDLLDYSVKNLGYVAILHSRTGVEIRLRKNKVSLVALTALFYWLTDHSPERVLLSCMDQEWQHELVGSKSLLTRHLELLASESVLQDPKRFFHRDVGERALQHGSTLDRLFREWSAGHLRELGSVTNICNKLLQGRFTIVRAIENDRLVIQYAGGGYKCYTSAYIDGAYGTRLEDEPDWHYGQWITEVHRKVVQEQSPTIQDVDAVIGPTESTRQRFLYRRILLPFGDNPDNRFVLSSSLPEPGLNLRSA